jgi:hypothetical protein
VYTFLSPLGLRPPASFALLSRRVPTLCGSFWPLPRIFSLLDVRFQQQKEGAAGLPPLPDQASTAGNLMSGLAAFHFP